MTNKHETPTETGSLPAILPELTLQKTTFTPVAGKSVENYQIPTGLARRIGEATLGSLGADVVGDETSSEQRPE